MTRGSSRANVFRRLGYLLFFSMIFVPTKYQVEKLAVLAVVVGVVVIAWATGHLRVRASTLVACAGVSALGLTYCIYGLVRGNPGATSVLLVYVVWPLVYLLLASAITTRAHVDSLFRVLVYGANAVGAYGCAWLLVQLGVLPGWLFKVTIDQSQIFYAPAPGQTTASFTTLATLMFLLPFAVALALTWPTGRPLPVARWWVFSAVVLNASLAYLSGRRGLLLGVIVTPLVVAAVGALVRNPDRRHRVLGPALVLGGLTVLAIAFGFIDVGAVWARIMEGFNPTVSADAQIRAAEGHQLWAAFSSNPFFGEGFGATIAIVRDPANPWAYELSYLALLFNVGIVGFVAYAAAVGLPVVFLLRRVRDVPWLARYALPAVVGWATFLLGNATNPYLAKFDSLWVIFLPVALLNAASAGLEEDPREDRGEGLGGGERRGDSPGDTRVGVAEGR